MQCSRILACVALAIVSALVLVQANQYGNNNYARPHGGQYSSALSHYPGAGCQGYSCNKKASPYGPYHSYAVRPVIYGGQGMYHYKGYARHPPAPRQHYNQRYPRSYGMAPRPRYPSGGRNYGAPARHHSAGRQYNQNSYQLRPVKAVALMLPSNYQARPAHQYGSRPAAAYGGGRYGASSNANQHRYNNNSNNYNSNNYNSNNYNNRPQGSSHGNAY